MLNEAQKKRMQFLAGMITESEFSEMDPGIPQESSHSQESAFPELDGYKVFTYGVTYETITPESAEDGDAEDRGWEVEYTQAPLFEIVDLAKHTYGTSEPSSSVVNSYTWWTSPDPVNDRNYFEKGESKYYSLHIKDMTDREAQIIDMAIKGKIYWDDFGEGDPESVWVVKNKG